MIIFSWQKMLNRIGLLILGAGKFSKENQLLLLNSLKCIQHKLKSEQNIIMEIDDPVALDYWLTNLSRELAIPGINVLCISFRNPLLKNRGGGIIGTPFENLKPSSGDIERLADNFCLISFPGGPGIAVKGIDKKKLKSLYDKMLISEAKDLKKVKKIIDVLGNMGAEIVLCNTDGCGVKHPGGLIFIKKINFLKQYNLNEKGNWCRMEVIKL